MARVTRVLRAAVVLVAAAVIGGCTSSVVPRSAPSTSAVPSSSSAFPTGSSASSAAGWSASATPSPSPSPSPAATESSSPPTTLPSNVPPGSAAALLATLPIKGRAPMTGYSREKFGPAWADVDHNGCDTRDDILRRDLIDITYVPGSHCRIASGVLHDPYTGKTIHFVRGETTSLAVQIDHIVALGDAWQTGAQQWSAAKRELFANDPLELVAVDGPTNEQKGDADAASWLPPNKAFRCAYVARQIRVKAKYGLWVTQAEHDAMARVLANCPPGI
ncbi:MAG: HNH endonuclease family protein [Acidothermus cellulolyticus]|nr:HNH endonuclease family protein [Acidothermus cellulolyticus]